MDTVVFDKTGTLTTGDFTVTKAPEGRELKISASLAAQSDHPIARAILCYYGSQDVYKLDDVVEHSGLGVEARLEGQRVRLGRAEWIGVKPETDQVQTWLRIGENTPILLSFEDTLKTSSKSAVQKLKDRGLQVIMLSGDTQTATEKLAQKLSIDQAIGNTLPDQKLSIINGLGPNILMIGDGLNDTAALSAAHVSMSPSKAIDAARAASDFVLIKDDLNLIDDCIALSISAKRRMLENFGIAAAYNMIAIPIALVGLATPLLAALAMSASSICVSINALRLIKVR